VVEYYRKHGTPDEAVAMEAIISHFKTGILSEYAGRAVPIPVAIKPLLESYTNFSFLTGREIEGISQKQLLASERTTSRTSEFAKSVAQFAADATNGGVQISPIMIDTVLQGYLGTTAALSLAVADQAINPDKTDRPLHQIVGATAFAYDPVGTRRMTEFYELREKVVQSQNTLNRLMKENPERAAKFYEQNAERLAVYKMVNSTLNELEKTRAYRQWLDTEAAASTMDSAERLKMKQEVQAYENKIVEWVRTAKNDMNL
jgi:Ni,Fe-hydrogenase I large subunit